MLTNRQTIFALVLGLVLFTAFPAYAERLVIAEEAPVWAHWGAAALLYAHIGGGTIGLISGVLALATRKGSKLHRQMGLIFFVSMAVTYLVGGGVAPFLIEGQRPNFVAAVLALYLLISGVQTARRKIFRATSWEWVGLAIAISITAMGTVFMIMGANSETGTVDGSPPQAFVLFITFGGLAVLGEAHVLIRKTLSYTSRITRHLWRMCASFFIASGSLFLGQPQIFPDAFNDSAWPFLLSFVPIFAIPVWIILLQVKQRRKLA